MNKEEIVFALKAMDLSNMGARFELNEHLDDIGKIYYCDMVFSVSYVQDMAGSHVRLSYQMDKVTNLDDAKVSIQERLIDGNISVNEDDMTLYYHFPALDNRFIEQQVAYAIRTIDKMITICKH